MNSNEMFKIIDTIAKHYGINNQKEMAIEEMSELIQAIQKLKRCPMSVESYRKTLDNLVEEIADVTIMMYQLMTLVNKRRVHEVMEQKLNRQLKRIEEEKSVKVEVVEDDKD